jgi:hypothetical protein
MGTYRCISGGAGIWRVGLLEGLDARLRRSDVVVQIRKSLEETNQWELGGCKLTRRLTRAPENVMTAEEEEWSVYFFESLHLIKIGSTAAAQRSVPV